MQKDTKIRRKLTNKEAALPGDAVGLFVVGVVIVVGGFVETVVPASVVLGGLVVG